MFFIDIDVIAFYPGLDWNDEFQCLQYLRQGLVVAQRDVESLVEMLRGVEMEPYRVCAGQLDGKFTESYVVISESALGPCGGVLRIFKRTGEYACEQVLLG